MKTIKTAMVALLAFVFAGTTETGAQPFYREQKRTVIVKKRPVVPEYRVIRERNYGGYRNRYYDRHNHRYYYYNNGRRVEYHRTERTW